jgi:DNA end-binding protein Ku
MARPTWTGSISFGLVNIPIRLFTAVKSHRVAFHEFEQGTKQRIRHKRVAERSGREVPWQKIQKGFEVGKGRFVTLTDEEIEAAAPAKTRTIEIEQFVGLGEIDPVSWDQSYYVAPDGQAAAKAFQLLRRAMEDRGRVGIGRFVMRTKEYLVCIRPFEDVLALETMFFADEIREVHELAEAPARVATGQRELAMAGQLIDSLSSTWKPEKYRDTFRERIAELAEKKAKGQEIVVEAPEDEGKGEVLDLMSALKATLAKAPAARARGSARRPSRRKTGHAPRSRHAAARR